MTDHEECDFRNLYIPDPGEMRRINWQTLWFVAGFVAFIFLSVPVMNWLANVFGL